MVEEHISQYLRLLGNIHKDIGLIQGLDWKFRDDNMVLLEDKLNESANELTDYVNNLKETVKEELSPEEFYLKRLYSDDIQAIIRKQKWSHLNFSVYTNNFDKPVLQCVEPPSSKPIVANDYNDYFSLLLAKLGIDNVEFKKIKTHF